MNTKRRGWILSMCVLFTLVGCARKPDDTALADSIKARMFSEPSLKSEPVSIAVTNGEVTLTGDVSSDENRQKILSLAQGVPGVTKVMDSMVLAPAAAGGILPEETPAPASEPPQPPPPSSKPSTSSAAVPAKSVAPPASEAPQHPAAAPPPPAVATNVAPPAPVQPPPPPKPPEPRRIVIPEGAPVRIITIDPIDSDKNKIGSSFLASLDTPITVGDEVIVPRNANVYIKLLDATSSGKFKGQSGLVLGLDAIEVQGKRYPLESSTYEETGKSQGKQAAKKVGIGAAVGTAIGAIAGGGKGAAIGAGVGAGGGAAVQGLSKGDVVKVPSETKLDFKLEKAVEVTLPPKSTK